MARAVLELEFRDKITAGLKSVEGQLKSLSQTASAIKFSAFAVAASAVIDTAKQIAQVVQAVASAGKEVIQTDIQFEATLRNLTNATTEQVEQAKEYADVLARKLALDDDEVKRLSAIALSMGAQTQHLTKLLEVSRAYSLAIGVDMQTALQTLVRAGEGYTTLLRRQGIFLDETRVKSQGLSYVLDEVAKRFDFVNQYAESGAGKYENLQHTLSDVTEEVGRAILNSKGFQETLETLISTIQAGIPILELLTHTFTVVGYVAKYLVVGPLGTLVSLLKVLFQTAKGFITGGAKKAIEEFGKAWAETKEYVLEVYTGTKKTAEVTDALAGLSNQIASNYREIALLQGQISNIRTKIVQSEIEAYYLAKKNQVALRDSSNAVKDMEFLFAGIESSLQNAEKYLQDMASETLRQMERQVRTISAYIYDFVDSIWEGVRAGKDLVDVLKEAVEELAIAVAKAVVFQLIYRAVSSAIGLPVGPIPAFQSGGVVDRPTLALVGEKEREYIIPESKFPQPVVYVEVRNANPDTYARVLVQMSKRAKRMVYSSLAGA